jgi:hypothetical protein
LSIPRPPRSASTIKAALAELETAERKLAREREVFAQERKNSELEHEKQMDALAKRLAAASALDRQMEWVREQLALLRDNGIDPDFHPISGSGLTRDRPRTM